MDVLAGMTLTGYDTVIFTTQTVAGIGAKACRALKDIWPNPVVDIVLNENESHELLSLADALRLLERTQNPSRFVVYFFQDTEMRTHLLASGYSPMPSGVGPFSFHARHRPSISFFAPSLHEVAAKDRLPNEIDPYPAWFVAPTIREVTIVTPDVPADDSFSRTLVEIVLSLCAED